jgi:hypothetical protein
MKKVFFFTVFLFFSMSRLYAEETGEGAAAASASASSRSNWQNWVFAGSALVTVVVGVVIVSTNTGTFGHP